MGVYFRSPMLQNAAEARSFFLAGHNIAVLVDRSLSTEHERMIAAYLQVNRRLIRNISQIDKHYSLELCR